MPPLDEEAKKDVQGIVKDELKPLADGIEELKSRPQPAALAPQNTEQPTECPNCKVLQGELESWKKGEQFLAFDPALHAVHPNSKPKVDEFVEAEFTKRLDGMDKPALRRLIADRGAMPTMQLPDDEE